MSINKETVASPLQTWLWQPNLIVFISSACIMILELVAGRIVAPYVGISLYTWTSIIGIVLAGISLGNYLGGRLADHWASLRFLGGIFLLAGLSCFGILAADQLSKLTPNDWSIIVNILILTTLLFFLPCVILGMVSPVVVKLAVRDLAKTGSTVGKIYAAGTVGSIVGTFATGFILISWFGTFPIVWGVAVVLLVMGLLFVLTHRWPLLLGLVLLLAGASLLIFNLDWLRGPCLRETNYFCIKVREEERDGETVRVLILDRLVHSYTSLDDPTKLVYDYEQMYAEVTAYQAQQQDQLRALFIGGGGYTFPRYMAAVYPGSRIDVIEIDPGVTQVAYDLLGLRPEMGIVTYNQDARLFLAGKPTTTYNLIMGDAFNDFSVPYHLTTQEFNERVRAWLAADGLYVVNIIDGVRGDFLRAYVHTLRQTFAHVYLAPTSTSWREVSRSTFVIIAGDTSLDLTTLEGEDNRLLARHMLSPDELETVLAEGQVVLLTDQYAPVDQMLAPVFRGETKQ
ncbi:MAG: fused MFS/spermidine synthase [Anaerolineae bacterium]|nr:fused MFS/spermidine synthase [Anaerolineae bacterium]